MKRRAGRSKILFRCALRRSIAQGHSADWVRNYVRSRDHPKLHWKLSDLVSRDITLESVLCGQCEHCTLQMFFNAVEDKDPDKMERIAKHVGAQYMGWNIQLYDSFQSSNDWLAETALDRGASYQYVLEYAVCLDNIPVVDAILTNHSGKVNVTSALCASWDYQLIGVREMLVSAGGSPPRSRAEIILSEAVRDVGTLLAPMASRLVIR